MRGELPARKAFEDEEILAFHDISPVAPVHVLVIPKRHIASLVDCETGQAGILGRILELAPRIAREQGSLEGFRTIINTGRIGRQDVMHLHVHVIGGPKPLGRMIEPSH